MNLKEPGREYRCSPHLFTVGGVVSTPVRDGFQVYGVVKELDTRSGTCPTALCDFGTGELQRFVLADLSPVAVEPPVTVGKLYVLHYQCDNSNGITSKALGVSPKMYVVKGESEISPNTT
ncbi:MAG: hypothetical protein HFG02_11715 [Oscillibacter sp.]|nr:hypothetical protein [Oscillibacter sp.]